MKIECHHPTILLIRGVKICEYCRKVFGHHIDRDVEIVNNILDKALKAVKK